MFDVRQEILSGSTHKYRLFSVQRPVSFAQTLQLLAHDKNFRERLTSVLCESPFAAYRWETPPLTASTTSRNFEFVLVNQPELEREPDAEVFASYVTDPSQEIVAFKNLGADATLVVPSPQGPPATFVDYVHLASFLRGAPASQIHALWQRVSRAVQTSLGPQPLWLNTAGDGVAWLHIRLDSQPKYYCYAPYTAFGV